MNSPGLWATSCLLLLLSWSTETDAPPSTNCTGAYEWRCANGNCTWVEWLCDGEDDCVDGSDETIALCDARPCDDDQQYECRSNKERQQYPKCIPIHYVCDDEADCLAGEDELENCGTTAAPEAPTCAPDQFDCEDDTGCIPASRKCDHLRDCVKGKDEGISCVYPDCTADQFQCDNEFCISKTQACDGKWDCRDGSDESELCNTPPPTCAPGYWSCDNGKCISMNVLCNGNDDCGNGYDERQVGLCDSIGKLECSDNALNNCSHFCEELLVGYKCNCPTGYQLKRDGTSCRVEIEEALCGNSIVEEGEQCDCGFAAECNKTDHCCFPQESATKCQLKDNAQCSPSQGPCCTNACEMIRASEMQICQHESECSEQSFCNGINAACPVPAPKANLTACNDNTQVCVNGECRGSICQIKHWDQCYVTPPDNDESFDNSTLCFVACKNPNTKNCVSTGDEEALQLPENLDLQDLLNKISQESIIMPPGAPCDNFRGYCDEFQECRGRDTPVPSIIASTFAGSSFTVAASSESPSSGCARTGSAITGPLARLKNLLFNICTFNEIWDWMIRTGWLYSSYALVY